MHPLYLNFNCTTSAPVLSLVLQNLTRAACSVCAGNILRDNKSFNTDRSFVSKYLISIAM